MNLLSHVPVRLVPLLLAVSLSAGCSSDETTGPTPPVTTTAVRVSGVTALTSIGQSSQLTATAVLSDGNSQIVTGLATWTSRDPSVATVSAAGVLTTIAYGTTVIDATYQGQVGSADVRIAPGNTFILSGTVTDATTLLPVSGAAIEIDGGGAVGSRVTSSSSDGSYSLVGLSGDITATVSKSGYVTEDTPVTMTEDRVLNFALRPAAPSQAVRTN